MKSLIIGTGNMARGIGTRLVAGGHDLVLYNPDRADAEKLASELGSGATAAAGTLSESMEAAEVVVLASWYAVNLETAKEQADVLRRKIVIDISNPLNDSYDALVTEGGPSAAENIRAAIGAGAKVVKAFNTTFAGTLVAGEVAGQTLDVFLAGDDEAAKETVATLVRSGGLNVIDAGGLVRARQLEPLGLLGITLQSRLNTGFGTAWKLVLPNA
jgi:8-hydroxy-5-deazaflavin:NADPH oxidoreductase